MLSYVSRGASKRGSPASLPHHSALAGLRLAQHSCPPLRLMSSSTSNASDSLSLSSTPSARLLSSSSLLPAYTMPALLSASRCNQRSNPLCLPLAWLTHPPQGQFLRGLHTTSRSLKRGHAEVSGDPQVEPAQMPLLTPDTMTGWPWKHNNANIQEFIDDLPRNLRIKNKDESAAFNVRMFLTWKHKMMREHGEDPRDMEAFIRLLKGPEPEERMGFRDFTEGEMKKLLQLADNINARDTDWWRDYLPDEMAKHEEGIEDEMTPEMTPFYNDETKYAPLSPEFNEQTDHWQLDAADPTLLAKWQTSRHPHEMTRGVHDNEAYAQFAQYQQLLQAMQRDNWEVRNKKHAWIREYGPKIQAFEKQFFGKVITELPHAAFDQDEQSPFPGPVANDFVGPGSNTWLAMEQNFGVLPEDYIERKGEIAGWKRKLMDKYEIELDDFPMSLSFLLDSHSVEDEEDGWLRLKEEQDKSQQEYLGSRRFQPFADEEPEEGDDEDQDEDSLWTDPLPYKPSSQMEGESDQRYASRIALEREFFTNFRYSQHRPAFIGLMQAYCQSVGDPMVRLRAFNKLLRQIGVRIVGHEQEEMNLMQEIWFYQSLVNKQGRVLADNLRSNMTLRPYEESVVLSAEEVEHIRKSDQGSKFDEAIKESERNTLKRLEQFLNSNITREEVEKGLEKSFVRDTEAEAKAVKMFGVCMNFLAGGWDADDVGTMLEESEEPKFAELYNDMSRLTDDPSTMHLDITTWNTKWHDIMEISRAVSDAKEEEAKERWPIEKPELTARQQRNLAFQESITKPPEKIIDRDQEFDEIDHEQLYMLWTKRLLALPPGKHHHLWRRSSEFGPLYYDPYFLDDEQQDDHGRLWRGQDTMSSPAQVEQDLYNPWEDNLDLDGVYDKFQVDFDPEYSYLAQDDERMLDMIDPRGFDAAAPLRVPRDLTETAKDAMYMLHRSDPVRWHPRALASLFNVPLEITIGFLKIKAIEHNVYRMSNRPARKYLDNVPFDVQESMRWMLEQEYHYWDMHMPDLFTDDEVKMLKLKMGVDVAAESKLEVEEYLNEHGDDGSGRPISEQMERRTAAEDHKWYKSEGSFGPDSHEPYETVTHLTAWDEYETYAKPRPTGHRDYAEGEDMTFASFAPRAYPDEAEPAYSFIRDEDVMYTQELKKKQDFRFMSQAERLDFVEREQFAQTGPLGGPHPPEPPTRRLSQNVLPPGRHNWTLVDISDKHNANYAVAVRDKDGELRTPTGDEYHMLRVKEKDKHKRFTHVKFRDPGGVSVLQKYHKWQQEGQLRRLDPIFVIPHRDQAGEQVLPKMFNSE